MLHQFDLFLFDWSGTLSDDRRPVYEANRRMLVHYGLPELTFEQWFPQVGMSVVDGFKAFGVTDHPDTIVALYHQALGDVVADGTVQPEMYGDAPMVLHTLRGHGKPLWVLSAHPQTHLDAEAQRYGIAPLFHRLIGGVHDKASVMRAVVDEHEIAPHRALYIGDTVTDMRAARSVGLLTAAVSTGYHTHERLANEKPDFLFTSLTEMATTLPPIPYALR